MKSDLNSCVVSSPSRMEGCNVVCDGYHDDNDDDHGDDARERLHFLYIDGVV